MNILVLLAGILDPKWPIEASDGALPERIAERLVPSPFDEAALETALALRDTAPYAQVRAIVMGGAEAGKLARTAAAFTMPVATIEISAWWDQNVVAEALAAVAAASDLVLLGREFGDCDDGLVAALLAARLGRPLFARAQAVRGGRLMREAEAEEEWLTPDRPLVVSVTNDRRNRLRKPLLKNVMMAREAEIETLPPFTGESDATLIASRLVASARKPVECRLVEGSPEVQAQSLAELLA